MPLTDFGKLAKVRIIWRNLAIHFGEHARSRFTRSHRDHFTAAFAEAEPVRRSGRQMHERAWQGGHLNIINAKRDLALDDIKRFVPRMIMRRRAAVFRPYLQKYFIAAGLCAGSEYR